jgi:hypothetical protein
MNEKRVGRPVLALALAGCLTAGAGASALAPDQEASARAEQDDLALVRRAVAQAPAPAPAPSASAAPAARKPEARWLRVRIEERGGRKRVSVNLPMAFVRVLDDFPIDYDCGERGRRRCTLRLAEVLDALDQGEDLVRVDDEDTKVRVWIE